MNGHTVLVHEKFRIKPKAFQDYLQNSSDVPN